MLESCYAMWRQRFTVERMTAPGLPHRKNQIKQKNSGENLGTSMISKSQCPSKGVTGGSTVRMTLYITMVGLLFFAASAFAQLATGAACPLPTFTNGQIVTIHGKV